MRGFLLKFSPRQTSGSAPSTIAECHPVIEVESQLTPPVQVVLNFEQCLKDQQFGEASQLLIERENLLCRDAASSVKGGSTEEEVAKLSADRAALEKSILQTLQQSLSPTRNEEYDLPSALSSAIRAIQQEENEDTLWRQRGGTPPAWRPCNWRRLHDAKLQELVEKRMENHLTTPSTANQSSVTAEIKGMGLQLKEDLRVVVEVVKSCYPPQIDICSFYAAQYHEIFSTKLRSLTQFVLEDSDCTFLLRWINEYYPEILQKLQLTSEINTSGLGKLLPEEILEPLEQQYLSHQQTDLMTYIDRILEEARVKYYNGEEPKEDGCYVSTVSYDIIQFIHGMVTSAKVTVGDMQKAQKILSQLRSVIQRFQSFQEDVIRQNRANSRAQIKANLSCMAKLRDFLIIKANLIPQNMQEDCLSVLNAMKESAHTYLLAPVHKVLKPHYQKLGTNDWLQNRNFEKLLISIEKENEELQGSTPSCHQELMGQLYQEVTQEYVRRLLRGEIKLKDKQKQHDAYTTVKDNAERLHQLFSEMGSQDEWLREILNKIAEVLKLQDVPALQMHVASMGSDYPDLSERHVSALLKLKTNISKTDRRTIKATLTDTQKGHEIDGNTRKFFSRVYIK